MGRRAVIGQGRDGSAGSAGSDGSDGNDGSDRSVWTGATPQRLAPKLILYLTLIVIAVLGVAGFVILRIHQHQLQDEMTLGADQLSGTIVNGMWNAMLADRRDDAYGMMKAIARQPGIERIRIFNKEGRVMFSTDSEEGRMVDKNAEACYLCHARSAPLVRVDVPSRARVFHRPGGGRILGMVTPIYNEASCSEAACHAHPADIHVLGVVDLDMSLDRVDREMAGARLRALLVTLLTIVTAGGFIGFFVRMFVDRPIRMLIEATHAAGDMHLEHPIDLGSRDEIGELARAFDVMRRRLGDALEEINQFNWELGRKVTERTAQLQTAQQNLIRQDRLASLGQLSASMAHEINNPISGVRNLAALMLRILGREGFPAGREQEFRNYLGQIERETVRVGRIVTELLTFSRQSQPKRTPSDLNTLVRNTLALIDHKVSDCGAWVQLSVAQDLPVVACDPAQIMQVVLNLVLNAAESMPKGGRIVLCTSVDPVRRVAILEVEDSGAGISEENVAHVFDPFFTTKEDGKGVGLGLAVVYGIVHNHGGTIEVESEPGKGTLVRVTLPLGAREGEP